MQRIFIDSNIYLGFYNSNRPEFRKLLNSLYELKDMIFITHQIIDEINRNKLNVFSASIENYIKQSRLLNTVLPEHLDNNEDFKFRDWNLRRKNLEAEAFRLNSELENIIADTLGKIATSEDNVSIELKKVFDKPLPILSTTLRKARVRKELGNPPGKRGDPLGDQINWIQILENCPNISSILIVSNDQDYFVEYGGKIFLNPILYLELKEINRDIQVFAFDKLSKALQQVDRIQKIETLPSVPELDEISKLEEGLNEENLLPKSIISIAKNHKFYGGGYMIPRYCNNCKKEKWDSNGGFRKSLFGGMTYQYECKYCGSFYDTEEYEDKDYF